MNRAACDCDGDADAGMAAARAALARGDLATAERCCTDALARSPGDARPWLLLTETALLRDRLDAATICAERAVTLAPLDPVAHILRAKCQLLSGDVAQASATAERTAPMIGSAPEALDALGAIFGLLGRHDRAAELFRRAVAARPEVPQYHFNLAATERMTGQLDAAEAHCDAALALDRRYARAHYLRSDLRTQTAARNHVAEMERLLHEGQVEPVGEVMIRFALGKELEDIGEHERAFGHVAAGNSLHRRSTRYDHAAALAEVGQVIRTQTRAGLESLAPGFSGAEPVFVVGLPRTGTTLVERILGSHSAMNSVGEAGVFPAELRRALRAGPNEPDVAALGRRYVDAIGALALTPTRRRIDKTLQNYLHCGLIHAALPAAKIILVQRRPMDACWAMYKAHFQGAFAFTYDQVELADYYLAFRRLARHWQSTLPPQVLLEVNYEDIVRDPARESRRLIEFAGLPWEEGVLRFHESRMPSATASAVQVRRPVYASSVGGWRRHVERLEPLRRRLARELDASELT